MAVPIVQSTEIVLLLGAAAVGDDVLTESRQLAKMVVAADGGARLALAKGMMPDAVIGDFDSLDADVRASLPPERLHHIAEQDSTDFQKALRNIAAPLVLAVGFTGQRLDHELAVYNGLVSHSGSPVIVIGAEDICFHLTAPLTLKLDLGARVSLFPLAEVACASEGLKYSTDGLVFSPWGRVGTSNEAVSPQVVLRPSGPGMLVILPRAFLDAAIAALLAG